MSRPADRGYEQDDYVQLLHARGVTGGPRAVGLLAASTYNDTDGSSNATSCGCTPTVSYVPGGIRDPTLISGCRSLPAC